MRDQFCIDELRTKTLFKPTYLHVHSKNDEMCSIQRSSKHGGENTVGHQSGYTSCCMTPNPKS